jgi:hypothetical protein
VLSIVPVPHDGAHLQVPVTYPCSKVLQLLQLKPDVQILLVNKVPSSKIMLKAAA